MGQEQTTAPHCLVSLEVIAAMVKLARGTPPGALVEVGVYHGGTAWHLAKVAVDLQRPLFLYDTFTGIPYALDGTDSHKIGDFSDTSAAEVKAAIPCAFVMPGIFPQSAVEMGPIAFVHLDCDQYRSYVEALAYFEHRMLPGGVIWCDDADCLPGAGLAVREFAARTGRSVVGAEKHYLQF